MAKWSFLPWRQSSANKFRPDSLNYGCISVSKSGEVSAGDYNNKAVPVIPTGSVISFAGQTAPEGWLLCQGQAVSRTTYAQLFAVIGTTFGSGDGSTTFNLPDLRGRVAVGVDSDANLGIILGNQSVALTDEHNGPHQHTLFSGTGGTEWNGFASPCKGSTDVPVHTTSRGTGVPFLIMQPSLYLNQIIKI